MTKLSLLLMYILISFNLAAQKKVVKKSKAPDFCSAVHKIVENAYNNFENISDDLEKLIYDKSGHRMGPGVPVAINIPGTNVSYLYQLHKPYRAAYTGFFGNFVTEKAARIKAEQIRTQLSQCFPKLLVGSGFPDLNDILRNLDDTLGKHSIPATPDESNPFSSDNDVKLKYVVYDLDQVSSTPLDMYVEVTKRNDSYRVFLVIQKVTELFEQGKKEIPVQSKFNKEILDLLEYAGNDFNAIKGTAIKYGKTIDLAYVMTNREDYRTDFILEGTEETKIETSPDYTIYKSKFQSSPSPKDFFNGLYDKLKRELGNEFDFPADEATLKNTKEKDLQAVIYRKSERKQKIELILNIQSESHKYGTWEGVYLIVESYKK